MSSKKPATPTGKTPREHVVEHIFNQMLAVVEAGVDIAMDDGDPAYYEVAATKLLEWIEAHTRGKNADGTLEFIEPEPATVNAALEKVTAMILRDNERLNASFNPPADDPDTLPLVENHGPRIEFDEIDGVKYELRGESHPIVYVYRKVAGRWIGKTAQLGGMSVLSLVQMLAAELSRDSGREEI
jgi:hypothetical protein